MKANDPAVVGLLLVLIVASAVPVLSTGVTWLAALLLVIVWSSVEKQKGSL